MYVCDISQNKKASEVVNKKRNLGQGNSVSTYYAFEQVAHASQLFQQGSQQIIG
jgi:hypothetical protein